MERKIMIISAIPFAFIAFLSAMTAAAAEPLRIVAIGASNTHGWYVGKQGAYPAKLQALLQAQGIDAQVINAGVPLDTTADMLKRIDGDVPAGTDIVILQPGANDRRFLVTKEQRAANIAAMERKLRDRSIEVIVYDEEIPLRYYTFDFIHLTGEGHAMIAASLLPRILATIKPRVRFHHATAIRKFGDVPNDCGCCDGMEWCDARLAGDLKVVLILNI
jgi:acyl-CoA thioesterase I